MHRLVKFFEGDLLHDFRRIEPFEGRGRTLLKVDIVHSIGLVVVSEPLDQLAFVPSQYNLTNDGLSDLRFIRYLADKLKTIIRSEYFEAKSNVQVNSTFREKTRSLISRPNFKVEVRIRYEISEDLRSCIPFCFGIDKVDSKTKRNARSQIKSTFACVRLLLLASK